MCDRYKTTACLLALIVTLLPLSSALAGGVAPPWSEPIDDGFEFTVPGVDNTPDLHGDINNPPLVVFFAGNQYMLVNKLIRAFRKANPKYSRVFAETLPSGKLANQIESGALPFGNMHLQIEPDIFTAGRGRIGDLQNKHDWFADVKNYASNRRSNRIGRLGKGRWVFPWGQARHRPSRLRAR